MGRFGVLGNPLAPKESIHATCPQLESAIACPFGSRKAANLGDAGYFIRSKWGPVDGREQLLKFFTISKIGVQKNLLNASEPFDMVSISFICSIYVCV